jgi:hypothetical protein
MLRQAGEPFVNYGMASLRASNSALETGPDTISDLSSCKAPRRPLSLRLRPKDDLTAELFGRECIDLTGAIWRIRDSLQ